jgi:hypothetical protein
MAHARNCSAFVMIILLFAPNPWGLAGQCLLANPSFELSGSGAVFGGWNQFGVVGSSTEATHGAVAARVSGPGGGGWNVSGYWQSLDSAPGERWSASVRGWHTSTNPITGQSKAILNIEWRDSGGNLISYESHTVADTSTPLGEVQNFSVASGPAPTGTVKTRLLLGVLQSPTDPSPDVYYDQATFYKLGSPSHDEIQWNDFPGGRTISFRGRSWRVKGPGYYGPGPSLFSDSENNVWVDLDDRLHMTIKRVSGSWYSTEVTLEEALGYGDYVFTTLGRLDVLDVKAVLGLFLWEYADCYDPAYGWWNPNNEVDVEFSRWGDAGNNPGQFVAQPYDYPGNLERFNATFSDGELTSHAFRWLHDRVEFRSWRGGPNDESPATMIHEWTYTGPHIPRPEQPRVHINLWQFSGPPSTNQEVIIDEFTFVPDSIASDAPLPPVATNHLSVAVPNPFNPRTTIRYTMEKGGTAEIIVFDALGRRIRTLMNGFVPAGNHEVAWNGRDDSGKPVASGVYLCLFRTGGFAETRKLVLLR